ncbi:hypothetical protein NSQ14_03535 [Caldifermentibacillus hisashii]|uniref:hypothetical protein n=1 Tax=Caldifermentibacillus hisashii TaxID=996558 RepID=UPI0031FDA973
MVTRTGLRRQKMVFLASKRRREQGFVVKKWCFSPQNGDENKARHQKIKFPASKWRRDQGSSPKNPVFHPKLATRLVPY